MSFSFHAPSRRGRRPPHGQAVRGLSLVEVLMTVTVFALAITTSITTLQRAFVNLDSARNIETACRILQCEMEKERLLSWSQVSSASYVTAIDSAFSANPAVAGRFTLTRSTSTVPNRSGKMLQITLTVTWKNFDGRTQSRSQTTYYGNGGLQTYFTSQT